MIYDLVPFLNELEMLKIRMTELDSVVHQFIVVEAHLTHKGEPKPLYFAENRSMFDAWKDKTRHIIIDDMPKTASPPSELPQMFDDPAWKREWFQIDRASDVIHPGDTESIIYTDVDEIPRAEAVRSFTERDSCVTFHLPEYHYFLNWKLPTVKFESCMIIGREFKRHKRTGIRHQNGLHRNRAIDNAGWHFSSMGGAEMVRQKLKSFCHWNRPGILEGIRNVDNGSPVETLIARGRATKVAIDDTYPKYIRDNLPMLCEKGYCDLPLIEPA